jgi:hypothetical protein
MLKRQAGPQFPSADVRIATTPQFLVLSAKILQRMALAYSGFRRRLSKPAARAVY